MNNNFKKKPRKFSLLFLISSLLIGQFTSIITIPFLFPSFVSVRAANSLNTIDDFLSLSDNTIRELDKGIDSSEGDLKASLEQLKQNLQTLSATLKKTYQDNLNVSLDSLGTETKNQLVAIERILNLINKQLKKDKNSIKSDSQNIIKQSGEEANILAKDVNQKLNNTLVIEQKNKQFLVNKSLYNSIGIFALIGLALGLLLSSWLILSRKLKGSIALLVYPVLISYLAVCGVLAFVSNWRNQLLLATGIGKENQLQTIENKPLIWQLFPQEIALGETKEVEIWGNSLHPDSQMPTAKIGDRIVPVKAVSKERIVLDVSTLSGVATDSNLNLEYDLMTTATTAVKIDQSLSPDLMISKFDLAPNSKNKNKIQAKIAVTNQGKTVAQNFTVKWQPSPSSPLQSTAIGSLAPNQTQLVTFDFAYPQVGTFNSIAEIDLENRILESQEDNNSQIRKINIKQPQLRKAQIEIDFQDIIIENSAEIGGKGEMWLDFVINGQKKRWPPQGTSTITQGKTYDLQQTFQVTLAENEKLNIAIKGTEKDDPRFLDDLDSLGEVNREFSNSEQWGEGSHSDRSSCSDGCYVVNYTIKVNWLD